MCLCSQVCERRRKKKSGRVNGLIRDVQVQSSHFEYVSESERSASYCAGLLLKSSHHPHMTTVQAGTTTGWLKTDTDDFFCGLLTHSLFHQITKRSFQNQATNHYSTKEKWTVRSTLRTLRITHSQRSEKTTKKDTKQLLCEQNFVIHLELFVGCTERKENLQKQAKTRILSIDHKFLLSSQLPYVHDQPLAVVLVVNRLHIHHCSLDPGFILSDKQ